jgi:hypothetical protein
VAKPNRTEKPLFFDNHESAGLFTVEEIEEIVNRRPEAGNEFDTDGLLG